MRNAHPAGHFQRRHRGCCCRTRADLMVMGTYGTSGLMQTLMGSSTERIIEKTGCSVLIARAAQ
ncbi:MAG TPA: universal stress protein [Dissulfurispiraceae bacterium]|nr:universal stress protein [Dissulfurispiraceae bacterium]